MKPPLRKYPCLERRSIIETGAMMCLYCETVWYCVTLIFTQPRIRVNNDENAIFFYTNLKLKILTRRWLYWTSNCQLVNRQCRPFNSLWLLMP